MKLNEESKGFILGFFTSVVAGVITLWIYYNYIQVKTSQIAINEYTKRLDKKINTLNEQKLKLEITTSEYYNNQWNPILTHIFYGNNNDEIDQLIKAHRKTDVFFDASFTGEFKWNEGTIRLKNIISDVSYNLIE